MKLSQSSYEEFIELYRDYYGAEITLNEAMIVADNLVTLLLEINTS